MTRRVLIVDDHALFRDGVASLVRAAGLEVVGEAGDGEAGLAAALRLRPDLILMDIHMPRLSGLETLRAVRAQLPDTQVVMLTVSDADDDLFEAIRSGAHGYLLKNLDSGAFLASLEALERGEVAMSRQMASRVIDGMARQARAPAEALPANTLTARETELLRLVAEGLTNRDIGARWNVSENTVKYHMRNLLQKLNLRNRTEVAAFALRHTLATSPPLPTRPPAAE